MTHTKSISHTELNFAYQCTFLNTLFLEEVGVGCIFFSSVTMESYSVARRSWQPGHSTPMGEAPLEIDAVCGDRGQKGKHAKGKRGKDKGKGKHKGKHESSPKFEGYCGHCGKWRHKQKDCRYKNTVAEVDEEESVEPPNSSASSSTTRATPPPPGLSSAGTVQSTTGTISTLMEAHAHSDWLCELVTGSDDVQVREGEFVHSANPNPENLEKKLTNIGRIALKGWVSSFHGFVCTVGRCPCIW